MRVTIIAFCLIGAVFANPISYNHVLLDSSELDANTTELLSVSQSSENSTSELQSSEEIISNQSSESESSESPESSELSESSESTESSESSESTSEDKTSEESDSQSDEDHVTDFMAETRDNSMSSEENVRKSWVQVFASVVKDLSTEDNSSTEVSDEVTGPQPTRTPTSVTFKQTDNTTQGQTNLQVARNSTDSSTESSSSESHESSEASDSSDASESAEDSDTSDSTELEQVKANDCVNGTQSCESEEYFFQDIGDDAHYAVDNLLVPDDDERELSLRR